MDLIIHPFFDAATGSWSYVLANPGAGACAIVDPVLDYDDTAGVAHATGAERIVELVRANGYTVEWILETHVHADRLSAARYLKSRFVCAQTATGRGVIEVQQTMAPRCGLAIAIDGSQFDRLLEDGERLCLGHTCARVMATPGHTPGCVTFAFEGFAVVGDTVFAPDAGTARCDFPGGDAPTLYRSLRSLYALPADTRLLLCHDYPAQRDRRFWVRVAEQRADNVMLRGGTGEAEFVAARERRDAGLGQPRLIDVALPASLAGGILPGGPDASLEALREAPRGAVH